MRETIEDDLGRYSFIGVSTLASHDAVCCESTQLQLMTALDRGSVEISLAAIPSAVSWEAVVWPAYWCTLTASEDGERFVGDCGVHAALAALVLQRHGIAHARGQIAIDSGGWRADHWRAQWLEADVHPGWIGQFSVYHEVLRIGDRYWDPSEARWFDGCGSWLVSGRVVACRDFGGPWSIAELACNDETVPDGLP